MNHYLMLSLTIFLLIIVMIIIKYKSHFFNQIESFKIRFRLRRAGRRILKKICKRTCKGCKYKKSPVCLLNPFVCPSKAKKCKKAFNKDFKDDTFGLSALNYSVNFKSLNFGSSASDVYTDNDQHLNAIDEVINSLDNQKKKLSRKKRKVRALLGKNNIFQNELRICINVNNQLKNILRRVKDNYNPNIVAIHETSDTTTDNYNTLDGVISSIDSDLRIINNKDGKCFFSKDTSLKGMIDLYREAAVALKNTIYDGLSINEQNSINNENFQNRYPKTILTPNNHLQKFNSKLSHLSTIFKKIRKEIHETFRTNINPTSTKSKKNDIIEGFQTPNQVSNNQEAYNKIFGQGTFLGLTNSASPDNTYNTIYNEKLDPYMGDLWNPSLGEAKDSSNIDTKEIAYNVRQRANSEFLPYTMKSCNEKWSSIDYDPNENARLSLINTLDWGQKYVKEYKKPLYNKALVDWTKNWGFWDDTKNAWVDKETSDNARNCNGIMDGQIENNNVVSSVIPDYIGGAQELELQRKQLLSARRNIYANMIGSDSKKRINEPIALCPILADEELPITDWTIADKDTQENHQNAATCLSKNSFSNDIIDDKRNDVNGIMNSGRVIGLIDNNNGQDKWLENIQSLQNSRRTYTSLLNNSQPYNYQLKEDGNVRTNFLDTDSTDLLRLSGNSIQRSLQDRDWEISTAKWNKSLNRRKHRNKKYVMNHYLSLLNNLDISDLYNFIVEFNDSGNNMIKNDGNILFLLDNTEIISNLNIVSANNFLGVARVYKNEYQYDDYVCNNTIPTINLPSLKGLQKKIIGFQYNILSWELDEIIECGYDLKIVCTNFNSIDNLYNSQNGYLCFHNDSQFGKCYYSRTQDNPTLNYDMSIIKNNTLGGYLIMNKNTNRYLAYGINYQNSGNWNFSGEMAANEYGLSLDDNKEARTPVLYYVTIEQIMSLKGKNASEYAALLRDLTWFIERISDNKYTITSYHNASLWYTSDIFSDAKIIDSSRVVTTQTLGYINCKADTNVESESGQTYCSNIGDLDCYNKYFFIIPKEPEVIAPENQGGDNQMNFILRDSTEERNGNGIYWYKNLREPCKNISGRTLGSTNTWFRAINDDFPVPYADFDINTGVADTNLGEGVAKYSKIKDMYDKNNQIITSLDGGDGYQCSKSNYCHVERNILNKDKDTGKPNPVYSENKMEKNSQDDSRQITLSYRDKDDNVQNQIFNQPINRYSYKCVRNDFGIFKIYNNSRFYSDVNNQSDGNVNMSVKIDPNLRYGTDDPTNNNKNKNVGVHVFSYDTSYKEGRDYGISIDGNYIWFKKNVDVSQIGFYQHNQNELLKKCITVKNFNMSSQAKHSRRLILQWYDKLRFQKIGYNNFEYNKVYAYPNFYAGTDKFKRVFIPSDSS